MSAGYGSMGQEDLIRDKRTLTHSRLSDLYMLAIASGRVCC
jgi:hypothetical protein